jgi:hypothetical protein
VLGDTATRRRAYRKTKSVKFSFHAAANFIKTVPLLRPLHFLYGLFSKATRSIDTGLSVDRLMPVVTVEDYEEDEDAIEGVPSKNISSQCFFFPAR